MTRELLDRQIRELCTVLQTRGRSDILFLSIQGLKGSVLQAIARNELEDMEAGEAAWRTLYLDEIYDRTPSSSRMQALAAQGIHIDHLGPYETHVKEFPSTTARGEHVHVSG